MPWTGSLYAFEEALFIPWGKGAGRVAHRWESSGNFGPTDFEVKDRLSNGVDGRFLYLLDGEQRLLHVFDLQSRSIIEYRSVPPGSRYFALHADSVAIWDGSVLHRALWNGPWQSVQQEIDPIRAVISLDWGEHGLSFVNERYRSFRLRDQGLNELSNLGYAEISRLNSRSSTVKLATGETLWLRYGRDLGTVEYLGDVDDRHYLIIEEILSHAPIHARERILQLDSGGMILSDTPVPFMYFSLFQNRFAVVEETLYCIISSPKGLHVLTEDLSGHSTREMTFPPFADEPYHYNNHVPRSHEGDYKTGDSREDPISRSQMMSNARDFVDLLWNASESNITDGLERMPDGGYVITPEWVTVGPKRKVPYKWGGFTSVEEFVIGATEGRKCGDIYLHSMSHSDDYCVGVDCSGFVSRCWDTDIKYKSATIHVISSELPTFRDMLRGDALNKPHHHIRLCAEDNPPGLVLTMEAGGDWRVSYRAFKLTSLNSYTPIRFDGVIEEFANDPYVFLVKTGMDLCPVRRGPSIHDEIIALLDPGSRYATTAHHDGWYHLDLPSGTGVYSGWCFGGTMTAQAKLEGAQETPILRIVADALNAHSGPGEDYDYATTVSNGQQFAVVDSSPPWYAVQIAGHPEDSRGWLSDINGEDLIRIISGGPAPGYGAHIISLAHPPMVREQQIFQCTLVVDNIGCRSWNENTLLRTTEPRGRASAFISSEWIDSTAVTYMDFNVLPYQRHTVVFSLRAPFVEENTVFVESFGMSQDGYCWFGDTDQRGPSDDGITVGVMVTDADLPDRAEADAESPEEPDWGTGFRYLLGVE